MRDPYKEGYEAFRRGKTAEEPPYQPGEDRVKWEDGWEDAQIDAQLKRRSVCTEQPAPQLFARMRY